MKILLLGVLITALSCQVPIVVKGDLVLHVESPDSIRFECKLTNQSKCVWLVTCCSIDPPLPIVSVEYEDKGDWINPFPVACGNTEVVRIEPGESWEFQTHAVAFKGPVFSVLARSLDDDGNWSAAQSFSCKLSNQPLQQTRFAGS